ncbi:hypothetical protein L5515_017231 [Caenorhabditis briggsae]|uniref:Exonuclease domain-containing protein n=2 Tax=Caenorhabditis briggsae TaxID=6238 RepID=A0AAE9FDP2_CAEBR|nr:hypothetical protein L5515_017231 [Caenorhabditis briggsae]
MAARYRCPFENLVILDFKTTCEENNYDYLTEIIQISATVLNIRDKVIVKRRSDIQTFVRPVINPLLSEYCAQMTGIDQNTINTADTFPVVYNQFVAWLQEHNFQERSFAFVCENSQNMWRYAQYQFLLLDQALPAMFRQWISLEVAFRDLFPGRTCDHLPGETLVEKTSNHYNIEFTGNEHYAMDKSFFLAKVTKRILDDNNLITVNQNFRCFAGKRTVPLNVDPNWKTNFQSAMLVIERMLPLVFAYARNYFPDESFGKCFFCRQQSDVCTGLDNEQYPDELFEQLVEPSVFAIAARLVDDDDEE